MLLSLITAGEFAKRAEMPLRTLYHYCREGLIPCQRIGATRIALNPDDVENAKRLHAERCAHFPGGRPRKKDGAAA